MTRAMQAGFLAVLLSMGLARAADHRDGPTVRAEPAADINDVLAWMSPDTRKVNLVMTVLPGAGPGAVFSDSVQYVFHTTSGASFDAVGAREVAVLCVFDAAQTIQCWVGDQAYVTGDASDPSGITSTNGRLRVFAGRRDDPFFFNGSGFAATADIVVDAAPGLSFDGAGCPALDTATSNVLVTQLRTEPDGSPAIDDFAGADTLAIVAQVDRSLLTSGGPVIAVWGSTNARP